MKSRTKPHRSYGEMVCPICGTREDKSAPNQMFCQKCRKDERAKRIYKEQLAAAALANMPMKGMSIAEVDRIAKALHISYGQVVAGGWDRKTAGAGTPTVKGKG